MNTLEALDSQDVTLFTPVEADFDALNDYYHTSVDFETVQTVVPEPLSSVPLSLRRRYARVFQHALLSRIVATRHASDLDVLVSTFNEAPQTGSGRTVQYVHCPLYGRDSHPVDLRPATPVQRAYSRTCSKVAGVSPDSLAGTTVLVNSDWMGEIVKTVYGTETTTIYPPIDVAPLREAAERSRDRRDFVMVGRVTPDKNVLETIDVIAGVRDRGHDIGLTIVGPIGRSKYGRAVSRRAAGEPFVTLLGEVNRERLVEILGRHRYGIHGKTHEHFGIVVAEMVAAQTLPIVPDSGGQREIVGHRDELLYGSTKEAERNVDRILSDSELERRIREELPDPTERFGRRRFRERIRSIVTPSREVA